MFSLPIEKLEEAFATVRTRYPRLPILAIQWIYPTNGRYEVAKSLKAISPSSAFFSIIFRTFWNFFRSCLFIFSLRVLHFFSKKAYGDLKKMPFESIAKTWGYPRSSLQKGEDFYFGNLAHRLQSRGIKFLTLCGNAKESHWRSFFSSHSSSAFPYQLPELCLVRSWNVMVLWLEQCQMAFYIFFQALKEKEGLLSQVLFLVSKDCLRYQTLRNALFYFIGKKACVLWKPTFFVSLYEGHAWEKCLWLGIKKGAPSCKIVAYQHTVIFKRTLSLRKPSFVLSSKPDVVLTTGPRTLEIVREGHEKNGVQLIPFGSFRFKDSQEIQEPCPMKKTVLVLPEGLLSESCVLFNAAIQLAGQLQDHCFIFRTHPILPFDSVLPHLQANPASLKNILISKEKNIEKDFERSSALLYRGSSSVLYGVLKGLKPFYFQLDNEEPIDPLFELNEFKEYVFSVGDLEKRLKFYEKNTQKQVLPTWIKAAKYVQEYTMSVKEKSMELLLESVGL